MHLGSELEFDPVAETTTPLRSSDRYGIEWTNTYQLCDWLSLNADYSWSHGRLLGSDPDVPGNHIPQANTTLLNGAAAARAPMANRGYTGIIATDYLTQDQSGGLFSCEAGC